MEHAEKKAIIAEIQERFPDIPFPRVYSSPVHYGTKVMSRIPEKRAVIGVVPSEDGDYETCYSVVSDQYQVVHHEIAIHKTLEALTKLEEFGEPDVNIRLIGEGEKMNMKITFPEVTHEVRPGDQLNPRVDMRNSYDTMWEFFPSFGAVQQICTNGIHGHKILTKVSKKHRQNLDVDEVVEEVTAGMRQFSDQVGIWSTWAQKELDGEQFGTIWEALPFGEKHREEIKTLSITGRDMTIAGALTAGAKINAWDLHSAVTQFLTHNIESELVRIQKTEDVAKVFHNKMRSM